MNGTLVLHCSSRLLNKLSVELSTSNFNPIKIHTAKDVHPPTDLKRNTMMLRQLCTHGINFDASKLLNI